MKALRALNTTPSSRGTTATALIIVADIVFCLAARPSWAIPIQAAMSGVPKLTRPALNTEPSAFHDPLHPPVDFPFQSTAQYENAQNATALLFSANGSCSGTFVSTSGVLLTALHCIQNCLLAQGAAEEISDSTPLPGIRLYRLRPANLKNKTCTLTFNIASNTRSGMITQEASILATGNGFLTIDPTQTLSDEAKARSTQLQNQGYGPSEDFVFLRLAQAPTGGSCLLLSPRDPRPLDAIYALSYPGATRRLDGFDAPGFTKRLSFGHVTQGVQENACIQESLAQVQDPEELQNFLDTMNPPELFWSDIDTVPGSSGSAAIDSQGKIAGLNVQLNSGFHNYWTEYCAGWTKSIRTQHIVQEITENLDDDALAEIFSCHL